MAYSMDKSEFIERMEKKCEQYEPALKAYDDQSDRATAIVVACVLDELLEKVIKASYIKDQNVNSLFKNDRLLQSFYAKVNIAYFSGLISNFMYHDLKLIGEIRNKFAHGINTDLKFTHSYIVQRINKLEVGFDPIPDARIPKLRFVLAVSRLSALLQIIEELLLRSRPPHLIELLPLNEFSFEDRELAETVQKIMQKD